MLFFLYSIVYILSLLLAIWFLIFLLKVKDGSEIHRYMIMATLTAVFWFLIDFFTLANITNLIVLLWIWKLSFFLSWSLIVSITLFLVAYVGKINVVWKSALGTLYVIFSYTILFTDWIVESVEPLVFAGQSNYKLGVAFPYLGILMLIFLALGFYFVLEKYLADKNKPEKKIDRVILWVSFLAVFLPAVSNIVAPYLSIELPRLAVLSIITFILSIIYLIFRYKAFGIEARILGINTKIVVSIILVSLIPIVLISLVFYRDTRDILEEEELINERYALESLEIYVNSFLYTNKQDLLFVAGSSNFVDFINSETEEDRDFYQQRAVQDFIQFSSNRNIYNQIRYLDYSGQEVIRIDNDEGIVYAIGQEELQNKSDRYYFSESVDIVPGTIYVSPLDLNIENNEIEIPYNPMIRYSTPIINRSGERQGVVIFNVSAGKMLDRLKELSPEYSVYMVNKDGYFLINPNQDKEWGFMLENNTNVFEEEPGLANNIFSGDGIKQFVCEEGSCYVTSKRIYIDQNIKSYQGFSYLDNPTSEYQESYWIVYTKVGKGVLVSVLNKALYDIYGLILAILLVLVVISVILGRQIVKPINELKRGIGIITRGDLDYQIEIDSDDEIGDVSLAFNQMTKAIKDSRAEVDKKVKSQTKEITAAAKEMEDQQSAILNVLEDVEEEKEKTLSLAKDLEKFKLAVDNASDHIAITDENGTILYGNKAVEKITGYSIEEVAGKKAGTKEMWGGLMDKKYYQKLWNNIKKDKKVFSGVLKNRRKNGEEYDAAISISPILDEHGHVKFFVAIERDVSKEMEIDRAKSEFVSLASHQLRTPLSTINWYAEMLLSGDAGKINKEQEEYLREVYKGNQRMVDLVNALLNVSRIELGTLAVEPENTSLIDLSNSVLKELEPQIDKKRLKIVKKYNKQFPSIKLDPKLMRIVFQNLLSNAVKYTPDKGNIIITISKNRTHAKIAVADTGMGIPSSQQDKIFTKLFRADNVREKNTDGTGLGLYIVKAVIEQFGGKVGFKSVEDKGTTFFATIPLKGVKAKEGSKGLEYTK